MKKFFTDNLVLIAGITLPIIVIVFFGLATTLPKFFVKPPQYNLLFATGFNEYSNTRFKADVRDGKLKLQYLYKSYYGANGFSNTPRLFIFDVHTFKAKEIKLNLPSIPVDVKNFSAEINVPQLGDTTIDTSLAAPDGYTFQNNSPKYNLMTDILFGNNSNQAFISKGGI